jgi:hypothetical protein
LLAVKCNESLHLSSMHMSMVNLLNDCVFCEIGKFKVNLDCLLVGIFGQVSWND